MSVAAAGDAVSTHHYQPTPEQIRLAQLIEDKKHDQPEVQETLRKVLDVVANSSQEEALVALFDCDYDCEKAVALLIEKGPEMGSEWRTATNHKLTKKQQQKLAATKNEHGDFDENGYQQRGNDNYPSRAKPRGGNRSRHAQNGGDSQTANNTNTNTNNSQQNENYNPQQRQRGNNSYRGRYRANHRGGFRGTDRNSQQQQQQNQDSNVDSSVSSDINRRNRGALQTVTHTEQQQQEQDQWDVGNWNGETLIYLRTTQADEIPAPSPAATAETQANVDESSKVANGQPAKLEFDPIEAARQIKNVIGIGQTAKSVPSDAQQQQQQPKPKSTTGQTINNSKVTPSPTTQTRIPQQAVIFSDHYNGGINKIDIQFGNLPDSLDESSTTTTATFYPQGASLSTNKPSQRTIEQSTNSSSSSQPVTNQQQQQQQQHRVVPTQIQQQPQQTTIPIKPVVTPQYTIQQQQHPLTSLNIPIQSLLFHAQQQPEPVTLDTSYDPTTFSLQSMDFNTPYFMPPPPPMTQPQNQPRYLVSQPHPAAVPPPQQQQQQQQTSTKNAQTPTGSASATATTAAKKAPTVPPGMFPPTGPPPPLSQQAAYSTAYNVQQQQGPGTSYPYDAEHLFTNTFMPLTNPQQTQSPTGTYGSVTPPVQHQNLQQQQTNTNNNDNKTMNYRPAPASINENLMLLQQYQQYALQQSNNQQQGQQTGTHSPAPLSFYLGHPPSGPNYSPGHQIMYAQAANAMAQQQQQASKQQGSQYNQNNPAAGLSNTDDYYNRNAPSNKDGQYMYAGNPQTQRIPPQSAGQQQQSVNKQQPQQRPGGNVYNNQQRSFQ